jgi:hypothetical protein
VRRVYASFHLPNQMDVVGHDNEAVDDNTVIVHQKPKALNDYVLVLVGAQKMFPF